MLPPRRAFVSSPQLSHLFSSIQSITITTNARLFVEGNLRQTAWSRSHRTWEQYRAS